MSASERIGLPTLPEAIEALRAELKRPDRQTPIVSLNLVMRVSEVLHAWDARQSGDAEGVL